jgi:hypothetical protein
MLSLFKWVVLIYNWVESRRNLGGMIYYSWLGELGVTTSLVNFGDSSSNNPLEKGNPQETEVYMTSISRDQELGMGTMFIHSMLP